jgi:hypothetical protein
MCGGADRSPVGSCASLRTADPQKGISTFREHAAPLSFGQDPEQ